MTTLAYRPDVDGLRAIAVLLVVAFHAFPAAMPGGYIGVDAFFVISGYLITLILLKSAEEGSFSILDFYQRRIRRIFPALVVVLASSLGAGWYVALQDDYAQIGKHVAAGAGFVANLVLWSESGYFDERGETKPLLHLWSLGVEEQFYLVWPLLIWWALSRQHRLSRLLIALALLSFIANVALVSVDRIGAFFSPISRFWELLVGAYIALVQRPVREAPTRLYPAWAARSRNLWAWSGLGLLGFAAATFSTEISFPGFYALIPVLGAALLIAAGPTTHVNRHVLSSRGMVWIGLVSYPLYLWHWPLLVFYREYTHHQSTAGTVLVVFIAVLLAWLTYRWLEQPVRHTKRPLRTAIWLAIACAAIGLCGLAVHLLDGISLRARVSSDPKVNAQIGNAKWHYSTNDICTKKHRNFVLFCVQSSEKPPTVILLGNSYANHLYPGLIGQNALAHDSLINLGSCDPSGVLGEDRKNCDVQDELIRSTPSLRYAFISSSWPSFDARGERVDTLTGKPEAGARLPDYLAGLRVRLRMLVSQGITPVIFLPKPEIPFHIRKCYGRSEDGIASESKCSIPRSELERQRTVLVREIQTLRQEFPSLRLFDQAELFCEGSQCNFIKNGLPLLRDNGHLSLFGSEAMASALMEWSKAQLPALHNGNSN